MMLYGLHVGTEVESLMMMAMIRPCRVQMSNRHLWGQNGPKRAAACRDRPRPVSRSTNEILRPPTTPSRLCDMARHGLRVYRVRSFMCVDVFSSCSMRRVRRFRGTVPYRTRPRRAKENRLATVARFQSSRRPVFVCREESAIFLRATTHIYRKKLARPAMCLSNAIIMWRRAATQAFGAFGKMFLSLAPAHIRGHSVDSR